MSDQELTVSEFVVLMIDIHRGAKRSSCTETDADKIIEQATNITRGTQYSKLFETMLIGDVDITLNKEDVSHRKP